MIGKIRTTIDKLRERLLGKPKTSGYHTQHSAAWGLQYRRLPPLTFPLIEYMLWDSAVIIGLGMREAPIANAELAYKDGDEYRYGVKADNEEVGKFVIKQIERFWANDLHKVLQAQVYGWMAAEITYRLVNGRIEFDTLLERHAADVRALELDGEFWGVKFMNTGHTVAPELKSGESFWHGFRAKNGDYYGRTILRGAFPPWCDKNLDGGAMDVRKLYMHKDAYGGAVLGYPNEYIEIVGKGSVPARDVAREMVEQYKAGGVSTKPNVYDVDNNPKWTWEWRQTGPVPTHIFEFPKDLDREMLRGMEIPDEILLSGGAGSWEGKKVPLQAFCTQENIWGSAILSDFDRHVLRNLVLSNFGKPYDFDAQLKPFAVQLAENENEGDGKTDSGDGFGAQWAMPQGRRQPTALSLEHHEHLAELAAAEVVGQAETIVEAAQRAIERRAGKVTKLATAHAPKGGITLKGKKFKGGEFIPGRYLEGATTEQKKQLSGKWQAKRKSASATAKTRTRPKPMSAKAKIAKDAHKMVDKEIQRYAEEHNEPKFAKAIGGVSFPNGEAIDIAVIGKRGVIAHGLELKTMVDNKNNKITMKRSAMERKASWEKKNKVPVHTVVIDDHRVFNAKGPGKHDESKREIYYRRGYGSFRVGTMYRVKNMAELKRLIDMAEADLPPAAQRPAGQKLGKMA